MVDEERSPLLSEHHEALRAFGLRLNGGRDPYPGEPPPPYSAQGGPPSSAASAIAIVMCRVCHGAINVSGKTHQHVIKCPACKEATPIRNAPAGKKYVRCPCNCLLVCKSTSHLIACPRQHCKRVINLGPHHDNPEPQRQSAGFRVACGHCAHTFLWTGFSDRTLIRCPTCHKVSSIGRRYPRTRSLLCFMLFIALAASTAGLMVGTWSHARDYKGIYVTWVILILLAVFSLVRTFYWRCLKISVPVS